MSHHQLARSLRLMSCVSPLTFISYLNLKIIKKKFYSVMPEIHVTPEKIFLNTLPTQVKINCSVNSFPSSDIIWVYHSKRHRHSKRRHRQEEDDEVDDVNSESFVRKNNLILNSELSYNIYLQAMNETFKQSSIIIDIVTEKDYGIYACYANNSVGGQSEKFYIFGGMQFCLNYNF